MRAELNPYGTHPEDTFGTGTGFSAGVDTKSLKKL
jgi:hypothetical protein